MQVFHKDKTQLSAAATNRLQKVLGGRTEFSGATEPTQILVTPPSQAIRPIFKIIIAAVIVTAGLVWLNRPAPVAVPQIASLGIPINTNSD